MQEKNKKRSLLICLKIKVKAEITFVEKKFLGIEKK